MADQTTRDWKEVTLESDNSIWDYKGMSAGELLEGLYKGVENDVGPKKSNLYTIQPEGGEEVKVWGSTVLDNKLMGVPVGTYVRIEYDGMKKGKSGNEYHDFKVFFDESTKPKTESKPTQDATPTAEDLDKPVDLKDIPF